MRIAIEIESCKQCPFFSIANPWSTDGFDHMEDWICDKEGRKIQGSVEWHEEKSIKIPDWCPAKIENT